MLLHAKSRLFWPVAIGGFAFLFGGAVAAALVLLLVIAVGTSGDPRGGETVFKVAWSIAAFGIGPLGAAALSVVVADRLRLGTGVLALSVAAALLLYALTAWKVATPLSLINDCNVGVTWPDASIPGCD